MSLIDNPKRLKPASLERLTDKHRTVLACLAHGGDDGVPLSIEDTAARLRVRRAYVRDLMRDPLFKLELAQTIHSIHCGMVPGALHRLGELSTSSDEKISLQASKAIVERWQASPSQASDAAIVHNTQVNVNQVNVAAPDTALEAARRLAYALEKAARATAVSPQPPAIEGKAEPEAETNAREPSHTTGWTD